MKKSWYMSKTLWVAVADFLAVVASQLFADPEIAQQVIEVSSVGLPFLMVILRLVTKQPVIGS